MFVKGFNFALRSGKSIFLKIYEFQYGELKNPCRSWQYICDDSINAKTVINFAPTELLILNKLRLLHSALELVIDLRGFDHL